MDVREKLVELLRSAKYNLAGNTLGQSYFDSCLAIIADHLIANGVTVQQWIPVTERLPEDDVDVLTRRATGVSVDSHCRSGWLYDEYHGEWSVTHWMPLPETP